MSSATSYISLNFSHNQHTDRMPELNKKNPSESLHPIKSHSAHRYRIPIPLGSSVLTIEFLSASIHGLGPTWALAGGIKLYQNLNPTNNKNPHNIPIHKQ